VHVVLKQLEAQKVVVQVAHVVYAGHQVRRRCVDGQHVGPRHDEPPTPTIVALLVAFVAAKRFAERVAFDRNTRQSRPDGRSDHRAVAPVDAGDANETQRRARTRGHRVAARHDDAVARLAADILRSSLYFSAATAAAAVGGRGQESRGDERTPLHAAQVAGAHEAARDADLGQGMDAEVRAGSQRSARHDVQHRRTKQLEFTRGIGREQARHQRLVLRIGRNAVRNL